jgi:hypothetical protein
MGKGGNGERLGKGGMEEGFNWEIWEKRGKLELWRGSKIEGWEEGWIVGQEVATVDRFVKGQNSPRKEKKGRSGNTVRV